MGLGPKSKMYGQQVVHGAVLGAEGRHLGGKQMSEDDLRGHLGHRNGGNRCLRMTWEIS